MDIPGSSLNKCSTPFSWNLNKCKLLCPAQRNKLLRAKYQINTSQLNGQEVLNDFSSLDMNRYPFIYPIVLSAHLLGEDQIE